MKILNWYVTKNFLITFFMAIGILTFAMTGARLARVLDVIANGVPVSVFFQFLALMMPAVLTYTIPWAIMAAIMLVFGRLSADSETTAMKACGVSILQVISPIMLIVFIITGLCLYMQLDLAQISLLKSRTLMKNAAINQPIAMFEPGKPIHFQDTIIYIEDKTKEGILQNVQIYIVDPKDKTSIAQDISALEGRLEVDKERQILTIILNDCLTINKKDNDDTRLTSKELRFNFDFGESMNMESIFRRPKYMSVQELIARIRMLKNMDERNAKIECAIEVELNRRIAFALSPIAFLLLGLPLAIKTSRRETSVGLFISVILAGTFFLSIILCNSLTSFPMLYPQYLLWLPNIVFQTLGAIMTYRISQQ